MADDLPAGWRWATERETEAILGGANLEHRVIPRTVDSTGVPYTHDEADVAVPSGCGGCAGLGSHRALCPKHPDYHPWLRLARMAEEIGDSIGGNDPGVANRGYQLGGEIRRLMAERPWRGFGRT